MRLRTASLLVVLFPLSAVPAAAQGVYGPYPYGGGGYRGAAAVYPRVAYGGAHVGFAQPFIQGDYIGAPLTTVPSPSRLVPAPWSYGTYGVPTVSGIAAPPSGQPTLTVIHAPAGRRGARAVAPVSGEDPADVRVVNVSVPRR